MKVIVLGGFLGAGKTTFLLKLAHYLIDQSQSDSKVKIAIIENEIGAVSVDSSILGAGGLQTKELFAGCACCSLREELVSTIREVQAELDPETVIIESTGVGIPENIRELVESHLQLPVHIIVLVDGSRWFRLLPVAGELARGQLVGADTVIINKADLMDEAALADAHVMLEKEVPAARIFAASALDPELTDRVMPEICAAL